MRRKCKHGACNAHVHYTARQSGLLADDRSYQVLEGDQSGDRRVYTFRKEGDRVRLVVSSETDYNRDGQLSGAREKRILTGQDYLTADADTLLALTGRNTFSQIPEQDAPGACG